jgi:hypothetical protein
MDFLSANRGNKATLPLTIASSIGGRTILRTLTKFCFIMIGRADIEGCRYERWLPQASQEKQSSCESFRFPLE